MAEVVVMVVFSSKEGREDEVAGGLQQAAVQTHEEEGCLLYALHRGTDDATQFALIERWRSREDLDSHLAKPYVRALGERAADLLSEPPRVHFLEALPVGQPAKGSIAGA